MAVDTGAGRDTGREPWQSRALDSGLAAATTLVVGVAISADLGTGSSPGAVAYGFAIGLGGLMLVRRRLPVAVLLITAVGLLIYYWLGQPPIGVALPVAAALFSTAEQGRTSWAIAVASALVVVSTGVRLTQGDDPGLVLGYELPSAAALMAASIAWGAATRARRGWHAELHRREITARWEREREAAERVERERMRIARDLHDLLAHTTSVIALHTDNAREQLSEDPDAAERSLGTVRAACSSVTRELRATLGVLRDTEDAPDSADDSGAALSERLDELVNTARAAGVDVRYEAGDKVDTLPAVTATTIHRVVQEALTNVLRHSNATRAEVTIEEMPGVLAVRVSDDGAANHPTTGSPHTGWGIAGMRERVELLGGELTTEPVRDGFVVEATLPDERREP